MPILVGVASAVSELWLILLVIIQAYVYVHVFGFMSHTINNYASSL